MEWAKMGYKIEIRCGPSEQPKWHGSKEDRVRLGPPGFNSLNNLKIRTCVIETLNHLLLLLLPMTAFPLLISMPNKNPNQQL